ncbi:hypothetical protein R5M17_004012 [Proteus mirabilis]|uniref:hypothetical protein n=1 Tax=Proteus TaxID=583 RepID=UPI0005066B8B|nr:MULTISPECIES: hypothetical protein [Proteus]EKW0545979.1 hypothetical protein [Proteus mirabilis]EKW4850217.1 hypothetical protein [Proteus mirabilis]EKY0562028.1 hypothetical protein [Proteus mirabilis]ELA7909389.1 hypothetical protein [Proteus mirabilis]ELA9092819.1 hypothetical protein [Proteus mirabilis]
MKDKYYASLENYKDCIEIEPTTKDCFVLNTPSWNIDVSKQELIDIRNTINEILGDDNE